MCILFSYISKRCLNPNEFKLIILSNRDEYFNRPSKPAGFVNDFCIYGKPRHMISNVLLANFGTKFYLYILAVFN